MRPKPNSMERPLEPKLTQAAPAPTAASLPTCSNLCPQDVYTCMLDSSPASQGTADSWLSSSALCGSPPSQPKLSKLPLLPKQDHARPATALAHTTSWSDTLG